LAKYNLASGETAYDKIGYSKPFEILPDISKESLSTKPFDENKENILIVEDNIEMLFYLKTILMEKYNLYFAFNGREALDKINEIPLPDLILSDIMMEEMDGFDFFDALSLYEPYKTIPFIFLTASDSPEHKLTGLGKGAVDVITKPFSEQELNLKIDAHINLQKNKEKISQDNRTKMDDTTTYDKKAIEQLDTIIDKFGLTVKESEVLVLLLKGKTTKEICQLLDIRSESTIKSRIREIFKKLGVKSRVELLSRLYG
jgi:DNA-binding NarL/FixJ family response regulator